MTTKVHTESTTWVITINYTDGSILFEGGFKFYELGDALRELTMKGIAQGLGEKCGNPIANIDIH